MENRFELIIINLGAIVTIVTILGVYNKHNQQDLDAINAKLGDVRNFFTATIIMLIIMIIFQFNTFSENKRLIANQQSKIQGLTKELSINKLYIC